MNEGWKAEIKAYAKINLTLDVLKDRRPDGFHNILSVMQSINLHDKLFLKQIEDKHIRVDASVPGVPSGEENIVYKAIEALCEYTSIRKGLEVKIMKGIPTAAGLGGGSSDAAAI